MASLRPLAYGKKLAYPSVARDEIARLEGEDRMSFRGTIRKDFDKLKKGYPTYAALPKHISDYIDGLNKNLKPGEPKNTPCCMQVSEALNKAGVQVPPRSFWRANEKLGSYYYIRAVNELEQYFSGTFGRVENIKRDSSNNPRNIRQMKQYIDGKQGILIFGGMHTELWDQTHIMQDGKAPGGNGAIMDEGSIFGTAKVLFWEVSQEPAGITAVPDWLQGWWNVYDGNTYYYYFSDEHVVTYTKTEPKDLNSPPVKTPMNEGDVTITLDAQNTATIVLDWNPADGGATQETFRNVITSRDGMNGGSNRYSPLYAKKMK